MQQIIADSKLFGALLPYIEDDNITDINWNGHALWIDNLEKGRYVVEEALDDAFVQSFCQWIADIEGKHFNEYSPKLEAETKELRIVCIHSSVATSGTVISIRKAPAIMRISENSILDSGYADEKVLHFLQRVISKKLNVMICGLPGEGKTELLKFLTNFISPQDKVITIEDQLEIHYTDLHPHKDGSEFKINGIFDYSDAIKEGVRLLPKWILLAEARDEEVKFLLKCLSTGTHNISTIHSSNVRKIPLRIKEMLQESSDNAAVVQKIYNLLNVGIRVESEVTNKITRKISQIALYQYNYATDVGDTCVVYENGKWLPIKQWPEEYRYLQED